MLLCVGTFRCKGPQAGQTGHQLPGAGDREPVDILGWRDRLDHSLRVLRNGVDGTPMAPWSGRLGSDEMLAVAHYVRAFYEGGSR